MENIAPEILFKILLSTDYRDLASYCLGNTNIYNICQDEYFWKQKLDKDYPGLRQYTPTNLTYQQQYISLYNLPTLEQAIEDYRLDQVILLYSKGFVPDVNQLNLAAIVGALDILKYYAIENILPDPTAYYHAAINNRLNVLDWLYSKGIEYPEEIMDESLIIDQMGFNSVPILLWLEQHGVPITFLTANSAGFKEDIKLLEWLETNRNVLPSVDVANYALSVGNIELLNWLASRNILPDREGIREAGNNIESLKWLSRYYEPTAEWAIIPIQLGNIEILDWLLIKGIGYKEIEEWVKSNIVGHKIRILERYRSYMLNRREEGKIY